MRFHQTFLGLAREIAKQSTCLSRKVGCVVVANGVVLTWGFNETRNETVRCGDGGCYRCTLRTQGLLAPGKDRNKCVCIHAEIAALGSIAPTIRMSVPLVLYLTIPPCVPCAEKIHQHQIRRVVFPAPSHEGAGIKKLRKMGIEMIYL